MLQKTYDWMIRTATHKGAPRALAVVSFVESSFFPIPPDIMLIPMILADRSKAWWYATIATIASVVGGILGYAIGYFLLEYVGEPILRVYGYAAKFEEAKQLFNAWGVWILVAKGWTPFPYKILTISAGAFHMPLLPFIAASVVTRAMRFYLVAALLYFFGEPIRQFIETRLTLVTTAFVVLLVGGFVAARYIL